MKIGDIIAHKDTLFLKFKIIGDAEPAWKAWYVEPLSNYRGFEHQFRRNRKTGKLINQQMVFKDDNRWVVVG